ncbi:MAG: hypothetical protein KY468_05810 [Armatimonadetes bacterium]|nr:hypothetical protein [Armatimonadota bacterium]
MSKMGEESPTEATSDTKSVQETVNAVVDTGIWYAFTYTIIGAVVMPLVIIVLEAVSQTLFGWEPDSQTYVERLRHGAVFGLMLGMVNWIIEKPWMKRK